MSLMPSNHFHNAYSYEIGLTVRSGYGREEVEALIGDSGFEFESGYFDESQSEYYLIPRRDGAFTPFGISSFVDAKRNPSLPGLVSVRIQVERYALGVSQDFWRVVDIPVELSIEGSDTRRFKSAVFNVEVPSELKEIVSFGGLTFEIGEKTLACSIDE